MEQMQNLGLMQEFVLDKLVMQSELHFSDAVLASAELTNDRCWELSGQMVRFVLAVPSSKLPDQVDEATCESPLGLWQTFKHYHFPEWLKRRFPVKMERFTLRTVVKLSAIYPELPLHITDGGRVSIFIDKRTENTRAPV